MHVLYILRPKEAPLYSAFDKKKSVSMHTFLSLFFMMQAHLAHNAALVKLQREPFIHLLLFKKRVALKICLATFHYKV